MNRPPGGSTHDYAHLEAGTECFTSARPRDPLARAAQRGIFGSGDSCAFRRLCHLLTPDAIARNFALWPIKDLDFADIYAPYSFYDVASYDEEVTHLRNWIQQRLAWLTPISIVIRLSS